MELPNFSFEHGKDFAQGEVAGTVRLGTFEAHYEELFAEALEDGVITAEERARLDRAADSLGLDRQRLRQLEQALRSAYETQYRVKVHEVGVPSSRDRRHDVDVFDDAVLIPSEDPAKLALQRQVALLEARVAELERDLADARAHVAVEVDLSDVTAAPVSDEDRVDLQRRVRHDPHDVEALRSLYRLATQDEDADRQWCLAQALSFLGAATPEQQTFFQAHKPEGLIRPERSLSQDGWRRLLFHPDEELLTGEIFATIASAVLLGRVAALRRDKALRKLDQAQKQNPETSTVQAVRCVAWAASLLGMVPPPLYTDASSPGFLEMVPGVPPSTCLGRLALSGRQPLELAFLAGRHLSWYREEHFLRLLVPEVPDMEDMFLAALIIGNPSVPLSADRKRRITPLAQAIEPVLDPLYIDRLRGYFLRFVEDGGRTNLQRWATAADRTSARTGFLLCGDLDVASAMLTAEEAAGAPERIDDLLVFLVSDRYANLRRQLGIAVVNGA